jgi:hypothetical protein
MLDERRVTCEACGRPAELIIEGTGHGEIHGWTCRGCGHVNRVRVPGQIVCRPEDAIAPLANELPVAPSERRAETRVALTMPPLFGRQVGDAETFRVEEASATGFSISGRGSYQPGASYRFRVWATPQHVTIVAAVCRHSKLVAVDDRSWTYRAGFQLLPQSARRLRSVLRAVTSNTDRQARATRP